MKIKRSMVYRIHLAFFLALSAGCASTSSYEESSEYEPGKKTYKVESWDDADIRVRGEKEMVLRKETSFEEEIATLRSVTQSFRLKFYAEHEEFHACYLSLLRTDPSVARVYEEFAPTIDQVDRHPTNHDKFIVDLDSGSVVKEQLLAEVMLEERRHQYEIKSLWTKMKSTRTSCQKSVNGLSQVGASKEAGGRSYSPVSY